MTTIDKQTTNQDHDLGKSKQTRYTPPKLVILVSADGIEGKATTVVTESGSAGPS